MNSQDIKHIVIVGGGTAGWMSAAALAHVLKPLKLRITLVESEQLGTVGVGEATIPHLRYFNARLGINEHEFIRTTQATYKLGIEFVDWGRKGESYIHPFGDFGQKINGLDFIHYWTQNQSQGVQDSIFDYSMPVAACQKKRFTYPSSNTQSILSKFSYAFQMDASGYAQYLRAYSEERGVQRVEGKITDVIKCKHSGDIETLHLGNGKEIHGDFFIDCSGFRSLLLGETLSVGYDDWSKWLPCNRAIAVPSTKMDVLPPYTKAKALSAGWKWSIPLQHRTGNGVVYCSNFLSDDEASEQLLQETQGDPLADLNFLKFTTGRRRKTWSHNCLAIGLSSGFLEPLESTSIYLIQIAIMTFIEQFPQNNDSEIPRKQFNQQMALEYERIRDFIILHYHATHRDDSEFWNYCRTMDVPDTLKEKLESFTQLGYLDQYQHGLFLLPSWVAVLVGQGFEPQSYHPFANAVANDDRIAYMAQLKENIHQQAEKLRPHNDVLAEHCQAKEGEHPWPTSSLSLYDVFS